MTLVFKKISSEALFFFILVVDDEPVFFWHFSDSHCHVVFSSFPWSITARLSFPDVEERKRLDVREVQ
jgi:hypothetical protein